MTVTLCAPGSREPVWTKLVSDYFQGGFLPEVVYDEFIVTHIFGKPPESLTSRQKGFYMKKARQALWELGYDHRTGRRRVPCQRVS